VSRWIVSSSIRVAVAVLVAAIGIIIIGGWQLRRASVDTLPEFGLPQIQVQTEALGLSAAEVEQLITVPLEDEFNGLPFLDTLRSQSLPSLSDIELTFHAGTDIYRARQLVTERVAQGPSVVNVGTPPVMIEPESSTARVMMIGLSSASVNPIDVSTIARWRIRPRLLAVPGVANVSIWGQRDQQLQVLVDPAELVKNGVTLDQVINTTGDAMWTSPLTFVEASSPGADGFIDTPNQRISLQHVLPISTPTDLAQVPIEDTAPGKPLTLGQVSQVIEDHPALRGDTVLSGGGTGFLLVVDKLPGANTAEVTRDIQNAIAELTPGLTGITVDTAAFNPAGYISTALSNVGFAGLLSLLLVVLWLGIAWQSWRVAVIAFVAVALSYVTAALVLYARGTTFNALILAGLAIGIGVVVDDLAHGVDAMKRDLAERRTDMPKASLITDAVIAARRPLGYALAIVALGLVPLWLVTGFAGMLSRNLVGGYVLSLLAATAVALVGTPVLAYVLLPSAAPDRPNPVARGLARFADKTTVAPRRRAGWAWGAVAVLALMASAIAPQIGGGTLPPLQDRNLVVAWSAMPATSLPEMQRLATSAAAELRAIPGVRAVNTNVGQALFGDQTVDVNSADTWITLDQHANYGRTVSTINQVLDDYPGVAHRLSTYPAQSVDARPRGGDAPVRVRLYGTNDQVLQTEAERIGEVLRGVGGLRGVNVTAPVMEPVIQIDVNVANAAKYGLKPGDIRRASAVLVAGIPVGSYYQDQQIFDVAVWSKPADRANLTAIQNLLVDTPDGKQVPLKDVADVAIAPAAPVIAHDNVSRYRDITAQVDGDLDKAVATVRGKVAAVPLPLGYHAEISSDVADRSAANARIAWYAVAAAIAIYLLLQAGLRSWGRAALVLFTLPLAVAGGALSSLVAGRHATVGTYAGLLLLFAIAVRNGLRMVRRAADLEADGLAAADAVNRTVREQALPVVATAIGILLAMVPFVVRGAVAGLEFLQPFGWTVIGGLVTTTVVGLGLLPALYLTTHGGDRPAVAVPADGVAESGSPAVDDPPRHRAPAHGPPALPDAEPVAGDTEVAGRDGPTALRRAIGRFAMSSVLTCTVLAAMLSGCAASGHQGGKAPQPAQLIDVPGSPNLHKVVLTARAASQIAVQTQPVRAGPGAVVPVTAVIYDPQGESWTYTVPAERTYLRVPITVDHVDGDNAYLSAGPPIGTAVVTQGAPELLGVEYGVGEE
jgi:Cu/Ag efflux pump CusA